MVGCNPGGGSAVTPFMGTRFTKILLLSALAAVQTGAHAGSSLVELRQARTLSLELEDDSGLVVDGEWIPARTAQLEIVPGLCELWC